MRSLLLLCSAAAFSGACTWVELEPEAQQIALATAEDITDCERLSHVSAKVLDGVGFIDRSEEKMANELTTIARNEAARLGGDTIVPASDIVEGRQHFSVFVCND
ncbi:DUF4156 domain-containing protein [Gilvimarinus sp. SDUM040013]|uniref:DUF4156 domain-containing protein n=1 Tax=Gilvimarinus gilvus TaxID=3058038 RepID=A0ABU4RY56_9GAMM|nr:DUF4156 domain-containing protein [Gilvimarinus sp. SDUM040013]MDO3388545.1 DUF4156 domain-containing protein [Gilvimarinus sp. SDUM040013]MDX6848583.1 DUF4156 domain-containing protein [Gilvimarinus sp. SDUM040013]